MCKLRKNKELKKHNRPDLRHFGTSLVRGCMAECPALQPIALKFESNSVISLEMIRCEPRIMANLIGFGAKFGYYIVVATASDLKNGQLAP
jgi:hypothetical protein